MAFESPSASQASICKGPRLSVSLCSSTHHRASQGFVTKVKQSSPHKRRPPEQGALPSLLLRPRVPPPGGDTAAGTRRSGAPSAGLTAARGPSAAPGSAGRAARRPAAAPAAAATRRALLLAALSRAPLAVSHLLRLPSRCSELTAARSRC